VDPITDLVSVLHMKDRGQHMSMLEKFRIYVELKNNNHINEKYTGMNNILSDTIITGDVR
jgi:hypothetical protein